MFTCPGSRKKSIKHKQKNDTPNSTKHYIFFFSVTKYLTSSTNSSTVFQRTEQKNWTKSFSRLARLVNFLKVIFMDYCKDIFLSSQMHRIFNKVSRTFNKWNWGKPNRLFLEDFSHFPVFLLIEGIPYCIEFLLPDWARTRGKWINILESVQISIYDLWFVVYNLWSRICDLWSLGLVIALNCDHQTGRRVKESEVVDWNLCKYQFMICDLLSSICDLEFVICRACYCIEL